MYALCVPGAVNTQGLCGGFLYAIETFSFMHFKRRRKKRRRRGKEEGRKTRRRRRPNVEKLIASCNDIGAICGERNCTH